MTTLEIARCYHCDAALPARQAGRAGRPRHYCSDRCRQAAFRAGRRRELTPALPGDLELPDLPPAAPVDELIARSIMDARALAATFARLSTLARRSFSWRCERAAGDIARTIADNFPGL